ncbi:MAG: hypothetical protein V9G29_17855 [Burkholderiaceae bacterium]
MKIGVSTTPWFSVMRPRRASPWVVSTSKVSIGRLSRAVSPADPRPLQHVAALSSAPRSRNARALLFS